MARKPRIILPGYVQHIVQRGNNRQACFFSEADYRQYQEDLSTVAERHGCTIHAYVLMPNHVHLLLTPQSGDQLARLVQDLGRRYVRYINDKYARTGTLWAGRCKASLVDEARYGLDSRALMRHLAEVGMQTRPLWQPLHLSPAHVGGLERACPTAERLKRDALSLPCSVQLAADQRRIITALMSSAPNREHHGRNGAALLARLESEKSGAKPSRKSRHMPIR